MNINKKQSKLQQILRQEVAHTYPAKRIYHDPGNLRQAVFETHLGPYKDFAHWSDLVSCRANGDRRSASGGLSGEKHFQNYHRVLNRAVGSSMEASHILLGLLINAFAMRGPIIPGLEDTND